MTDFDAPTSPAFGNCSPYDSSIYVTVAGVTAIASLISLLSNILVLLFIILFKRWSFFNQRLVIYLSLATIAGDVAGILARVGLENEEFCVFSGLLLQVTSWMVLNAYIGITTSLLIKAFFTVNLEKLDLVTILFIFTTPIVLNWIPLVNNGYGQSGAWCWIRSVDRSTCESYTYGFILQIVLWYIPLYVILGILILVYCVVVIKFCTSKRKWKLDLQAESERRQALRYTLSLLEYPVIYFITNIFPFINRLNNLVLPYEPSSALWFLSGIFYHSQGMAIAAVFLFSIRKKLRRVSIMAALREWFYKVRIEEYPAVNVKEASVANYLSFEKKEEKESRI